MNPETTQAYLKLAEKVEEFLQAAKAYSDSIGYNDLKGPPNWLYEGSQYLTWWHHWHTEKLLGKGLRTTFASIGFITQISGFVSIQGDQILQENAAAYRLIELSDEILGAVGADIADFENQRLNRRERLEWSKSQRFLQRLMQRKKRRILGLPEVDDEWGANADLNQNDLKELSFDEIAVLSPFDLAEDLSQDNMLAAYDYGKAVQDEGSLFNVIQEDHEMQELLPAEIFAHMLAIETMRDQPLKRMIALKRMWQEVAIAFDPSSDLRTRQRLTINTVLGFYSNEIIMRALNRLPADANLNRFERVQPHEGMMRHAAYADGYAQIATQTARTLRAYGVIQLDENAEQDTEVTEILDEWSGIDDQNTPRGSLDDW